MIEEIKSRSWRKLWEFYFSIWFLDRAMDVHIKYNSRLGYENKDTIHIYSNGSEEAYFSEKEIESLKKGRRERLLSEEYMKSHEKGALKTMKRISSIPDDLFSYSGLLEEVLSYYRASRPEVFELIEDKLDDERVKRLVKRHGELRLELKKAWVKAEKDAKPMKERFAWKLGLSLAELERLTNDEIRQTMDGKLSAKDAAALGLEREKGCVIGIIDLKKFIITGREAQLIADYVCKEAEHKGFLRGKTANPGKVRGIVRVIPQLNYDEMINTAQELREGEILVIGMTHPDIVFACKKAAAFVTDEGGITSHAAVISREMGKPCVMGTKTATKVFKTGDMVEVDADAGVVRLIRHD